MNRNGEPVASDIQAPNRIRMKKRVVIGLLLGLIFSFISVSPAPLPALLSLALTIAGVMYITKYVINNDAALIGFISTNAQINSAPVNKILYISPIYAEAIMDSAALSGLTLKTL